MFASLPYGILPTLTSEDAKTSTPVRALILSLGRIQQIKDAELSTGKKPLVLLDGQIKERSASEGIPIVYYSGGLRTIAAGETLLL